MQIIISRFIISDVWNFRNPSLSVNLIVAYFTVSRPKENPLNLSNCNQHNLVELNFQLLVWRPAAGPSWTAFEPRQTPPLAALFFRAKVVKGNQEVTRRHGIFQISNRYLVGRENQDTQGLQLYNYIIYLSSTVVKNSKRYPRMRKREGLMVTLSGCSTFCCLNYHLQFMTVNMGIYC